MQLLQFQLVFDQVFRFIADVGFIIVSLAMYRLAIRRGQRHHLFWIVPWLIAGCLSLFYRISSMASWAGIWHRPPAVRAVIYFGLDVATCFDLLGTIMLYQVLRAGKLPTLEEVSDPDVWPPAPKSTDVDA